jgi:hypothetical protein
MNGKFMVLMIFCINFVMLMFSFSCASAGGSCLQNDNVIIDPIVDFFFTTNDDDLYSQTGLTLNSSFEDATSSLTVKQQGTSFLLDSLKMIVGFVALLTPLPMITMFSGLGLPLFISLAVVGPIFIIWIIALLEIIRGGGEF